MRERERASSIIFQKRMSVYQNAINARQSPFVGSVIESLNVHNVSHNIRKIQKND